MLGAFGEGMLLGLLLSIFIGPVFFLLIQTSINKGIKSALILSSGIVLSDALCILLVYFVAAGTIKEITSNPYFIGGGGVVFVFFGLARFFVNKKGSILAFKNKSGTSLFFQGMMLNLVNPSVLVFWLGAIVYAMSGYGKSSTELLSYFSAALGTYFIMDVMKIYGSAKLKNFLTEKVMRRINIGVGAGFVLFGIKLICDAFGGF